MKFNDFMENYRINLTDLTELKDIINISQKKYRIKKLIIPYIFKDRETYMNMVSMAKDNVYAQRLLSEAKITLIKLSNGDRFQCQELKKLNQRDK